MNRDPKKKHTWQNLDAMELSHGMPPSFCTKKNWLVVSNIYFYVHPYLGKIPILTYMFQRGWTQQLENWEKNPG